MLNLPHHQHEPTVTHHNHPKSIVYLRVNSWCLHSVGLDKGIVTHIHYYSIIQSIFIALKILCAQSIHSSILSSP